jgi:hypothetical protein
MGIVSGGEAGLAPADRGRAMHVERGPGCGISRQAYCPIMGIPGMAIIW